MPAISTLTISNDVPLNWTFYPVTVVPGQPPQRVAAGQLPTGSPPEPIDLTGFNPLWYGGPQQSPQPNAVFVGLSLTDQPPVVQVKVMHYPVEPGPDDQQNPPTTVFEGVYNAEVAQGAAGVADITVTGPTWNVVFTVDGQTRLPVGTGGPSGSGGKGCLIGWLAPLLGLS